MCLLLNFFLQFSQKRQICIWNLPVILSFIKFFVAHTSIFFLKFLLGLKQLLCFDGILSCPILKWRVWNCRLEVNKKLTAAQGLLPPSLIKINIFLLVSPPPPNIYLHNILIECILYTNLQWFSRSGKYKHWEKS